MPASFLHKSEDFLHHCTLKDETWDALPTKSYWKKYCTISYKNPRTKLFIRTKYELFTEKKRHLTSRYSYIIHPLSIVTFYWCIIVAVAFLVSIAIIPVSILKNMVDSQCTFHWPRVIILVVDFIAMAEIMRNCFTGIILKTGHIVLDQQKIIISYFKTVQCYIDIITCTPILLFCELLEKRKDIWYTLILCCFIKLLRIIRIYRIATTATLPWLTTAWYNLILYTIALLYWIHCTACFLPTVPLYKARYRGSPVANSSWIAKEKINYRNFRDVYVNSYFWATAMFLCVRHTSAEFEEPEELAVLIVCYIGGYIACAILFVFILQTILSLRCQSLKYETLTNQLGKYMSYRQLSIPLQQKMLTYYEHKFKSIYFREAKLMSLLSDQLRKEINLYRYVSLVKSVNILQRISESAVKDIVSSLKMELYLPNDVIMKAGTEGNCMYFLAFGTVAIYTPMGREICHMADGSYFGEIELLRKDNKRVTSAIAIEICEAYRLERKDFKRSMANEPDTYRYLEKVAFDRTTNAAFLEELHKKHIMERNMAVNYNA